MEVPLHISFKLFYGLNVSNDITFFFFFIPIYWIGGYLICTNDVIWQSKLVSDKTTLAFLCICKSNSQTVNEGDLEGHKTPIWTVHKNLL